MNKKPLVLFAGLGAPGNSCYGIIHGFEELGYNVEFVDWMPMRMRYGSDYLAQYLLKTAGYMKPEFILMHIQVPDAVPPSIFTELQSIAPVVHYTFDVRKEPIFTEWYERIAKNISLTVFASQNDVQKFKDKGIENAIHSHSSCDFIQYQHNVPFKNPVPRIVFIGNNQSRIRLDFPKAQERVEMVQYMKERFGNDFGVYGMGWENEKIVFAQEENYIYNHCDIAVTHNQFNEAGYCSDRQWRAAASGAFIAFHHYEGVESDFFCPTHTWKTVEELGNLCEFVLKDDRYQTHFAYENLMRFKERHTWKHRLENIISELKKHTNGNN